MREHRLPSCAVAVHVCIPAERCWSRAPVRDLHKVTPPASPPPPAARLPPCPAPKDERRVRKEKKARAQSIGAAQAAVGQLQREHRQLAEHAAAQRRGVASELAQLEAALLAGVAAAAAAADARLAEALLDRRRLLNTVLDLRGNIRVFCRCRPVQRHEGAEGNLVRVLSSAGKDEVVVADDRRKKHVRHEFDAAFGDATTQQQVFGQVSHMAYSCNPYGETLLQL